MARLAGCGVRVEPRIVQADGKRASVRPDLEVNGSRDECLIDITVVTPTAGSYVSGAAKKPLKALIRSVNKHAKYDELARAEGCKFFAFVIESYGALAPDTVSFLRWLAVEAAMRGQDENVFFNRSVKRLSAVLQRGNSRMLVDKAKKLRSIKRGR